MDRSVTNLSIEDGWVNRGPILPRSLSPNLSSTNFSVFFKGNQEYKKSKYQWKNRLALQQNLTQTYGTPASRDQKIEHINWDKGISNKTTLFPRLKTHVDRKPQIVSPDLRGKIYEIGNSMPIKVLHNYQNPVRQQDTRKVSKFFDIEAIV